MNRAAQRQRAVRALVPRWPVERTFTFAEMAAHERAVYQWERGNLDHPKSEVLAWLHDMEQRAQDGGAGQLRRTVTRDAARWTWTIRLEPEARTTHPVVRLFRRTA